MTKVYDFLNKYTSAHKNGIDEGILNQLFEHLGLTNSIMNKRMDEMSEGERKKVLILQTIVRGWDKKLIVFDEPTNGMDDDGIQGFIDFIGNFKSDRIIVIASHGKRVVKAADNVLCLGGR